VKKRFYILIVALVLGVFCPYAYGQVHPKSTLISFRMVIPVPGIQSVGYKTNPSAYFKWPIQHDMPLIFFSPASNIKIPGNHYTLSFGFFCRNELKLEKMTGLPIRFRLGSLDYCNFLERK